MKRIVMLGTAFETQGGISSVVNVYRADGLFQRHPITYLATHCDGSYLRKLGAMLRAWFRFMALLLTGQVALAHVHMSSRASFWRKLTFSAPTIWLGAPLILHLHSGGFTDFYEHECGPVGRLCVRWLFKRAARVVALSDARAQWIRTVLMRQDVHVIYNPVAVPEAVAEADRRQAGLGLFLGQMARKKGIFDLLEAVAQLRHQGVSARLALAGDGEVAEVGQAIARLGLQGDVQMLGWIGSAQKDKLLREASFLALPSHHEAMPMSVLEAMAMGLPVVSTPVGGIPEAVTDGVEGFLVQPGDVAALADRIGRLIQDPALAARMGRLARQKVERVFAASVLVPQVDALYDEFLPRQRPVPLGGSR